MHNNEINDKTQPDVMESSTEIEAGPEESCNMIALGDGAYPNENDGDEVETKVKGTLVVRDDGSKFLSVKSTDGVPVRDMNDEEVSESTEESDSEDESSEEESTSGSKSHLRADEALDEYMKNRGNEE